MPRHRQPRDGKRRPESPWPADPVLYEINTWVWLEELSVRHGRRVTLADVPAAEWDALAGLGSDAVWLMGVWERSPEGLAIANRNAGLLEDFRRALPDFRPEDNVGSPYCVRRYEVDPHLGGREGLAAARGELAARGLNLLLDFVPNHVAPDHPWLGQHPDYFVQGSPDDAHRDPASFLEVWGRVFALGRDPYFPAWPDVVQLNAFHPGLRRAAADTLRDVADQCDGVRCDMAMLLLNAVFERTWGSRAGERPATEYWADAIAAVRREHPGFLFVAEAYWDLEWELQQQGFDYCYDKRLYDRLEHESAESVRLHLCADLGYQKGLVRFLENHDEPRALAAFPPAKARAAAAVVATLPGARLFHEGQFEGRRVRLPVFLGRRPAEPADEELGAFYRALLGAVTSEALRGCSWELFSVSGWPDNPSHRNVVAWGWRSAGAHLLVVVNLSDAAAQARVRVPWEELRGRSWQVADAFNGQSFERAGDEMVDPGLYVDLLPWGAHVWHDWNPAG
ncbi:MAG: alpha-amylase [Deltaproteobacteria bacterium]|nr:alpha-amylase [Deltaproteobacteria bacterium]